MEKGKDNEERSRMVQIDTLLAVCFFFYPDSNPSLWIFFSTTDRFILKNMHVFQYFMSACVAAVLISFHI